MIKPAFSTVACPEWTLDRVAARAREMGFEAVELRTAWEPGRQFACDPSLTSAEKARDIFKATGVEVLSLATGLRFDEPVQPPLLGYVIGDQDRTIRWGKHAVDVAVGLECPLVRVFGFQGPQGEKRSRLITRVAERIRLVCDHAAKTGVKVMVENGGSFSTAPQLLELLNAVNSNLLGVSYSIASARLAGEDPVAVLPVLRERLMCLRVKDIDAAGRPCPLGAGVMNVPQIVGALAATPFNGPVVFEWDRAWDPALAPAEQVLPQAARSLFEWSRAGKSAGGSAGGSVGGGARAVASGRH